MFEHVDIDISEIKTQNIDGKRYYVTSEGTKYPSITTVLSVLSRQGIMEWRRRVGAEVANAISTKAARRGTNVHSMCEDLINNKLDLKKFLPVDVEMFKTIEPIINEKIDRIHAQESTLYSDYLGVAGRVDVIAEWEGRLSVIDFKTSSKPKKKEWISSYFQQTSAYAVMFEERTGIPVDQVVVLIAVDNSTPQIYIEKRDDHIQDCIDTIRIFNEEN
jgi:genome maintenance exonuclease 1|tara:strand:+ start:83 stop:736 length:654 start_codon:yes stop_codon:yes gene_type:complete